MSNSLIILCTSTADDANTSDDDDSSSSQSLSDGSNTPPQLEEGEIWVEYHPLSGKKPKVIRPAEIHDHPVTLPTEPHDPRTPAWYPFRTRLDFEQAELFIRFGCTDSYMDDQLKLIKSGSSSGHQITLKSSKEVHETLGRVPVIENLPRVSPRLVCSNMLTSQGLFQYKTEYFEVPFPKKSSDVRTYSVRYKDTLPSVLDIIEDNLINERICLYPERRFVQRPDGSFMRVWEENWSGDDWWNMQVRDFVRVFRC